MLSYTKLCPTNPSTHLKVNIHATTSNLLIRWKTISHDHQTSDLLA
jgi:hypothetical protein